MARRGSYGKPWRPPADGWSVPPLTYLGSPYQHRQPALDNLTAYQNTTQVTLQQNQVGRPETRFRPASTGGISCENYPSNGLPNVPWYGTGDNQFLPGQLPNTFAASGTNSFGLNCRQRGGKWVQFVRQHHGTLGFLDRSPLAQGVCFVAGTFTAAGGVGFGCAAGISYACPNVVTGGFQSPPQTKYLHKVCTVTTAYAVGANGNNGFWLSNWSNSFSSDFAVDSQSGKLTGTAGYTPDATYPDPTDSNSVTGPFGNALGAVEGMDFNATVAGFAQFISTVGLLYPSATAQGSYCTHSVSGTAHTYTLMSGWFLAADGNTLSDTLLETVTIDLVAGSFSRTVYALNIPATGPGGVPSTPLLTQAVTISNAGASYSAIYYSLNPVGGGFQDLGHVTSTGSVALSNANTSAAVYSDGQALLGYWNLADDAQYPPRTDGIWQIAPLMSRDERQGNVEPPVMFSPITVDDMRSPIADANGNAPYTAPQNPPQPGWTYAPANNDASGHPPGPGYTGAVAWIPTYAQMAWFDPAAYGFQYPFGLGTNAPATAWVQYALTGAVLGAPNPAGYQNYFDFNAQIWRCCQNSGIFGTFNDFYLQGFGQWLYDMMDETGAQLPHCATQWTNNMAAFNKPPGMYLIQGDTQTYDMDGPAGPGTDMRAYRADALWGQKCMQYLDLWPSYDFFRPAGADRFDFEELTACCVYGLTAQAPGGTFTSQDHLGNPITLTVPGGSVWGGWSVGGFYHISVSGSTVTLGTRVLNLPAAWTSPSGDTGTVFGMLRFPAAPAILGRDAVSTVTDNHDGTCTLLLPIAEPWLLTGDAIDLYSTAITYDGYGNRVSEAMTSLASNLIATVIDSTHIMVTASYAAIAGTQYIMSHGAPDWCWDDNGRKGDFVVLSWLFDYRTNGESGRLGTGTVDCSGNPITVATNFGYASFSQTAYAIPFKPCCAMAVFITPNGESTTNSVTIGFPSTFSFDPVYGARCQGEIEEAMVDLLHEAPHTPCGMHPPDAWAQDDGTCQVSAPNSGGGTTTFYAYAPMVEARITVPTNGGNSGTLVAPTPPTGIGYTSPVISGSGLQAPGMIGFDPGSGNPSAAWTFWGYRLNIENTCSAGCAFNYVDMENLACISSYAPPAPAPVPDLNTSTGGTGDPGLT